MIRKKNDKGELEMLMRGSELYYELSLPLMLKALIFVRYVHPSFVKAMAACFQPLVIALKYASSGCCLNSFRLWVRIESSMHFHPSPL